MRIRADRLEELVRDSARVYRLRAPGCRTRKPGGKVVITQSSQLVDIVTFNRNVVDSWKDQIVPHLSAAAWEKEELLTGLSSRILSPKESKTKARVQMTHVLV